MIDVVAQAFNGLVNGRVHDPLLASALYLDDGGTKLLFVGCDVLVVSNDTASRARRRIEAATGVPASAREVTATSSTMGCCASSRSNSTPV